MLLFLRGREDWLSIGVISIYGSSPIITTLRLGFSLSLMLLRAGSMITIS